MAASDFTPTKHDLVLYRGDSVELPLRFGTATEEGTFDEGLDLTDVDFAAQIRSSEDSDDIVATFTITLADQEDEETKGLVTLTLESDDTTELVDKSKWDVQATWPGDTVRTYLAGMVKVKKDVTRTG